jgi:hypothetical protein
LQNDHDYLARELEEFKQAKTRDRQIIEELQLENQILKDVRKFGLIEIDNKNLAIKSKPFISLKLIFLLKYQKRPSS